MTSEKVIHLDDGCYVSVYLIFLMQIYALFQHLVRYDDAYCQFLHEYEAINSCLF